MPRKWGSWTFDHRRLFESFLFRVFVFIGLNEGLQTSSPWMHRYESAGRNFLGIPAFRSLSLYCWSSFFILLWYSCRVPAKQKVITSKRQSICDNIFSYKSCIWIKKQNTAAPKWPTPRPDDETDLGGLLLLQVEAQQVWHNQLPSCSCCSCRFRDASLSWYILQ